MSYARAVPRREARGAYYSCMLYTGMRSAEDGAPAARRLRGVLLRVDPLRDCEARRGALRSALRVGVIPVDSECASRDTIELKSAGELSLSYCRVLLPPLLPPPPPIAPRASRVSRNAMIRTSADGGCRGAAALRGGGVPSRSQK